MKLAAALLLAQIHWTLPPQYRPAGYTREFHDGAMVLAGPGPSGAMTETFAAAPWRGQTVRLRATVRVEGGGAARLLLRVDRGDGALGFFDNMGDRPIRSSEWSTYSVEGEVAGDAVTVETGVESTGKGAVWVKDVAFERVAAAADAPELRAMYARVDAALAAGDTAAVAATALPDAEVVLPNARVKLSDALASQKGKARSQSTVTHARVAGDEATVWVNNETIAGEQGVLSSNRDEWTRAGGAWKLKRSTVIATRPVTPPDVLAEIRVHAGMPAFEGVRILLWQGAAPAVAGFTSIPAEEVDPRYAQEAGAQAVAWLKENAPEEAGPALVAFQGMDPARVAAVVRVFEQHRARTEEWARARHAALMVYQSKVEERPEEAIAANVIWWASEAMPEGKILVATANVKEVAGLVRKRYGRQVYAVRAIPRELMGGALFLDLGRVPAGSELARWVAAQGFGVDGVVGE
jgi:hypothetical protein